MPRDPRGAVRTLVGTRAMPSALVWGAVFGAAIASTALGYGSAFPTVSSRAKLAASFERNPGISALIGPARGLDAVAGFSVWRAVGVLSIVGAIWALLISTRMLRSEEDAGICEILLAGQTTRRRAAADALVGLFAGWVTLSLITAASTIAAGRSGEVRFTGGDSALLAVAVCANALVFIGLGPRREQMPARHVGAASHGTGAGVAAAVGCGGRSGRPGGSGRGARRAGSRSP